MLEKFRGEIAHSVLRLLLRSLPEKAGNDEEEEDDEEEKAGIAAANLS